LYPIKEKIMRLYVGNLSYQVTEKDLRDAFAAYEHVESVAVITDRTSGRSNGFGFVEISDEAEAKAAIEEMDGKVLEGRALKVNEARQRPDKPRGGMVADGPRVGATGMEVAAVKAAAGKAAREEDVVVRAAAGAVTASCLIGVILQACRHADAVSLGLP
jgi:hypothetical protein